MLKPVTLRKATPADGKTDLVARPVARRYVGHVDAFADGKVGGWVVDLQQPDQPVEVQLLVDNQLVSEGRTGHPRPDVSLVYDVSHPPGFLLPLDARHLLTGKGELRVTVKGSGYVVTPVPSLATGTVEVELSAAARDGLRTTTHVLDALRDNSAALIALNNNQHIRAKVDPTLGNVYLINGARNMASELFRTYGAAAVLRRLGYSPLVFDVEDVQHLPTSHLLACIFVRVAHSEQIEQFLRRLRSDGVRTIVDFDDLVFRPSLMHRIDGVRFLNEHDRRAYALGMRRYREMLQACDGALLTTESLAREADAYSRKTRVVPNFPLECARKAAAEADLARVETGDFVIGYYSGTLTHQADFAQCSSAIALFLRKYPDASLRVVGKLDLAEFREFGPIQSQITKLDVLPYEEMIADIARCHVNLAPLEIGNEFCESKSELKFFDAALSATATIASATETFRSAIQDGQNGFLASSSQDWFNILERLYFDPKLRMEVGRTAAASVVTRYSTARQERVWREALDSVGVPRAPGWLKTSAPRQTSAKPRKANKKRSLAVLLPDICIGSGGHRKALTFCAEFVRQGGRVEVCFISHRSDAELQSIVREFYFSDCGAIRAYNGIVPEADVAVATSWPTAYEVAKWRDVPDRFYFVQDFEALFSPMSTEHVKALHSYRLGLDLIAFGRWNQQKLKSEFGLASEVVDFPVDREIYFLHGCPREKEVLFYARPSQPRRLFELGMQAISIARPYLPDWKFTLYGEDIPPEALIDGTASAGKITDLAELANLYSRATLGMAFSTTNPSLIPFEMLACGLPVVDVKVSGAAPDFSGCDALIYSDPVPEALARTLVNQLSNRGGLESMSAHAARWAAKLPSDRQFALRVLQLLRLTV